MLLRLTPLALVMMAACEQIPDYSACPLVGTWQHTTPSRYFSEMTGPVTTEQTFRADGTMRTIKSWERPWRLHSQDGQRVVVEYPGYFLDGSSRLCAFEFPRDDIMLEVGAAEPRKWVRVAGTR